MPAIRGIQWSFDRAMDSRLRRNDNTAAVISIWKVLCPAHSSRPCWSSLPRLAFFRLSVCPERDLGLFSVNDFSGGEDLQL